MDPCLVTPLAQADPDIFDLIEKEKNRQWRGLELIASENFTSMAVMEANGSALTNKYSEGLPGARYYGGNEYVDEVEKICQKRALEAYRLDPAKWGVNVQPYSGSTANFSALTAMMKPFDRLMGLDLPSGGQSETGYVDYDKLETTAKLFRPNVLICGGSAYPRDWDYARMRKIADEHESYLMMDMAHISGLVAAQEQANPFDFCDVVTTTTHKTIRGPRAALIFFRKPTGEKTDRLADLESRINFAVFPSTQGGPHNNTIAAIAVALKQANTPEYKAYASQLRVNAQVMAKRLVEHGYTLVTGGTDNHCVLWDVRPQGLTGSKLEKLMELASITINKNAVPKDTSALSPGGVRLGTAALTSRGMKEEDFIKVADFLHRGVQIAIKIQETSGKALKDFIAALPGNEDIKTLEKEVEAFAKAFPMPGWEINAMKYKD